MSTQFQKYLEHQLLSNLEWSLNDPIVIHSRDKNIVQMKDIFATKLYNLIFVAFREKKICFLAFL